jgi:hypothetical protein
LPAQSAGQTAFYTGNAAFLVKLEALSPPYIRNGSHNRHESRFRVRIMCPKPLLAVFPTAIGGAEMVRQPSAVTPMLTMPRKVAVRMTCLLGATAGW